MRIYQNHDKTSITNALSKASSNSLIKKATPRSDQSPEKLSLRQILTYSPDFLDHKIFELNLEESTREA